MLESGLICDNSAVKIAFFHKVLSPREQSDNTFSSENVKHIINHILLI